MNPTTLAAVVRRFPLLGRPRPACPSLPERIQEIADMAQAAQHEDTDRLAEGAHALSKAALIASDCGMPSLARDLCWQHINVYRAANRPLRQYWKQAMEMGGYTRCPDLVRLLMCEPRTAARRPRAC